jgi:hypothetical protein
VRTARLQGEQHMLKVCVKIRFEVEHHACSASIYRLEH